MATLIKPGKPGEVKKGQRTTEKIVKTNPVKPEKGIVPMKKGGQTTKKK